MPAEILIPAASLTFIVLFWSYEGLKYLLKRRRRQRILRRLNSL